MKWVVGHLFQGITERRLAKLFRLATRVLLGFDYIHARNTLRFIGG